MIRSRIKIGKLPRDEIFIFNFINTYKLPINNNNHNKDKLNAYTFLRFNL